MRRVRFAGVAALALGIVGFPPASAEPAACGPFQGGGGASAATVVSRIRAAEHDGFDRVVFAFANAESRPDGEERAVPAPPGAVVPAYEFELSGPGSISAGPSGKTIPVDGAAIFRILYPQMHWTMQQPYTGSFVPRPGLPLIAEIVQGEQFEGFIRFGIGLAKASCPSVTALTDPPRLVLDFPR